MRRQRRLYGFHVDSLNLRQDYIKNITVILPGFIFCIKRDWVDFTLGSPDRKVRLNAYCVYSTCCTVSNYTTFRVVVRSKTKLNFRSRELKSFMSSLKSYFLGVTDSPT